MPPSRRTVRQWVHAIGRGTGYSSPVPPVLQPREEEPREKEPTEEPIDQLMKKLFRALIIRMHPDKRKETDVFSEEDMFDLQFAHEKQNVDKMIRLYLEFADENKRRIPIPDQLCNERIPGVEKDLKRLQMSPIYQWHIAKNEDDKKRVIDHYFE